MLASRVAPARPIKVSLIYGEVVSSLISSSEHLTGIANMRTFAVATTAAFAAAFGVALIMASGPRSMCVGTSSYPVNLSNER